MIYSKIVGTGSYFPENIVTNHDLAKIVDTSDEWIVTRTGIHTRHFAAKDELPSDMAYNAALKALDMAGMMPSDIDGIIFATMSPDYIMPNSASILQKKLGISGAFAFDINVACSGFIYALNLADSLIKTGKNKNILIACGEKLSSLINMQDRNTCILFGDAAGCVLVTASDTPGFLAADMHADGNACDALMMKGMGTYYLSNRDTLNLDDLMLSMKGNEIFKLAVRSMVDASATVLLQCGLTEEDINFLVPHQANIRIIEAIAQRFNISMDKVMINLDRRGNTSSATIPTTLDEGIRSGRIKPGHNILMAAFGGGLTWGAAVVKL